MPATVPLSDRILDCINHIQSVEYWQSILQDHSEDEILSAVLFHLRTGSAEDVAYATLFVQDLLLIVPGLLGGRATSHFKTPAVVAELERLVTSPSWTKRQNAVSTLGRTYASESADHLRRVRAETQDTDPLMLGRLAFEIRWLTCQYEIDWYVAHTLTSPSWLTRWAGLGVLDSMRLEPDDAHWPLKLAAYAALLADPDPRVQHSAAFLHEEMQFEATLPHMTLRADKRRARKALERRRPPSLDDLAMRFAHHLRNSGADTDTYTVEQLAAFIDASDIAGLALSS